MIGWVKDTVKKSKAAVIVQNLFEGLPVPWIVPFTRPKFANMLVEAAWSDHAPIFNGHMVPAPHPLAVAAISLSNGLEAFAGNPVIQPILKGSLGRLLMDVESNRWRYSLNGTDTMLLERAAQQYSEYPWDGIVADPSDGDAPIVVAPLPAPGCSAAPSDGELRDRAASLDARLKAFKR